MKFEGNKCGWVKLLGRVLEKSTKVLRRLLKKIGKFRVGLNKIRLKFSREKVVVICEKLIHFSPTFFFPDKVNAKSSAFKLKFSSKKTIDEKH